MRRAAAIMILPACVALGACSGLPTTVLESDVPIPPGMEAITTADADRSGSVLTRVRVVCRGDLRSVSEASDRVRDAFALQGWTCEAVEARRETATLTFAKDGRIATVDVHVNRIDPKMGGAVVRVRPEVSPPEGTRPEGSPPAQPLATK